jgi:hypothetical protein
MFWEVDLRTHDKPSIFPALKTSFPSSRLGRVCVFALKGRLGNANNRDLVYRV